MDAYEGETVRLMPACPMCNGAMEQGYILDRGHGDITHQSEWAAGEPQRRRWVGGIKVRRVRRYVISTLRCEECGFLASYATTPLNDM